MVGSRSLPLLAGLLAACAAPPYTEALVASSPSLAPGPLAAVVPSSRAGAREEAGGGGGAADLAKQLSNPVASLISVPLQFNYDQDIGPADGDRFLLNVQPVVPISLSEDWNLISRTIVPLIAQNDVPPGSDEAGLGDVVQSLFFSPVEPTAGGWIWGAGPVLLLPTATDETLGTEQLGLGPTAVFLRQEGPWTYGGLANHIWKVAGEDDRTDVNATFLQPFVTYTTPSAWTYSFNAESTYDWQADELALPLNVAASKVLNLGGQLVQLGGGLRYWVEETDGGPEGLAFRVSVTLLFPK